MPVEQVRRGRPKGSGLDDQAQLEAIRRKLEADPTLRPTTAIKLLGVSDPATIRRLRDKLRTARRRPEPTVAPGTGSQKASRHAHEYAGTDRDLAEDAAQHESMIEFLAQGYGVWLQALSTTMEAQAAAMETILRVPHVASVLRQQVLFNEKVMSMCASSPGVRKTLH
jgi:hypothetical protein